MTDSPQTTDVKTNPDDPRLGPGLANPELKTYLKELPPIRPLRATFHDAVFGYNAISGLTASMGVLSGLYGQGGQVNHYRILSGLISFPTYMLSAALVAVGRYQIYRDLRDYQQDVDPQIIMARDDTKNPINRLLNFGVNNVVRMTAAVGILTSSLTIAAGWTSGRWGEVASGILGIPSYLIRLLPYSWVANLLAHKPAAAHPEEKKGVLASAFQKALATTEPVSNLISAAIHAVPGQKYVGEKFAKITAKPMLLSAFLSAGKRTPGFIGALVALDPYQIAQYGGGYVGDAMIADIEKRCCGRQYSIIDKNVTPDGLSIAENILGKEHFHGVKKLFKSASPPAPPAPAV